MTAVSRNHLLIALQECLRTPARPQAPEIAVGVGEGTDRVYFRHDRTGERGVLLHISALSQEEARREGWQQSLGETFGEAVGLVSELMRLAEIEFQTDVGEATQLAARQGRYVTSSSLSEAVWLRSVDAHAREGMREANHEIILLHRDDFPRFKKVVEQALSE